MPLNLTPRWLSTWTTTAEKPHCGNTGVPFMKSTTSLLPTSWSMRWRRVSSSILAILLSGRYAGSLRRRRLQSEGVELSPHPPLQCLVNHLVLLHAVLSGEGSRHDMARVVVAVAAEILDRDLRVGQGGLDQPLDLTRVHRHQVSPLVPARPGPIRCRRPCIAAATPRAAGAVPPPI